jgi:hypothetical protein
VKYVQCVKLWPFDVLVLFLMPFVQILKPCIQFLMDTTESDNCSISDEEEGRRTYGTHVWHLRQRETHAMGVRLPFTSHEQKRLPIEYST